MTEEDYVFDLVRHGTGEAELRANFPIGTIVESPVEKTKEEAFQTVLLAAATLFVQTEWEDKEPIIPGDSIEFNGKVVHVYTEENITKSMQEEFSLEDDTEETMN